MALLKYCNVAAGNVIPFPLCEKEKFPSYICYNPVYSMMKLGLSLVEGLSAINNFK